MPDPTPNPTPVTKTPRAKKRGVDNSTLVNFVIPLALLVVAGLFVVWMGTVEPEKRAPADTTLVGRMRSLAPVRIESLQSLQQSGGRLALDVDGTVVPFQEAKVAAEVAGRVTMKSESCEAGQFVEKGDLLMKIDPTDYELEVQRLTRQKEQEYQALREVDQEMANARRLIKVAEEDIALQQREVDRQNSLPKNYASRSEIDQAQRGLLAARQQLVSVENQLDLLLRRRVRLEASERLAATNLQAAEINLQRTQIRAPIDGVIVAEEADVNTFVNRGQSLVIIENTSKAEVSSSIRMDQLFWVLDQRSGENKNAASKRSRGYELPETPALIEYVVSGRENEVYRWKGRLLSYDGIGLDGQTRTVPVRIVVDDPRQLVDELGDPLPDDQIDNRQAAALVRGMYVRVKLLIEPKTQLVVIPASAIRPGNRVFEFVPDETVLQKQPMALSGSDSTAESDTIAKSQSAESGTIEDDNQSNSETKAESFDPENWIAGRVISRRRITPVNALSVIKPNAETEISDSGLTDAEDERRYWVCEVADQTLTPNSLVVVSPIGTIDGAFMAARAKKSPSGSDSKSPERSKPKMASDLTLVEMELTRTETAQ